MNEKEGRQGLVVARDGLEREWIESMQEVNRRNVVDLKEEAVMNETDRMVVVRDTDQKAVVMEVDWIVVDLKKMDWTREVVMTKTDLIEEIFAVDLKQTDLMEVVKSVTGHYLLPLKNYHVSTSQ